MGTYAYEDSARKIKIYATKCPARLKDTPLFCWNPDCMAKVKLAAANSVHKNPYFHLASDDDVHIGWCENKNLFKGSRDYDETDFNFNNIIATLLTKKTNSSSGKAAPTPAVPPTPSSAPIHTKPKSIADIYQICKSLGLDEEFAGIERKRMLCDNKSNFFYSKGILGQHLVECTYHKFDPNTRTLYFKYPCNRTLANQYSVGLRFAPENADTFQQLVNFFLGCSADQTFVIAGDWKRISNYYISDCASKKAIYAI